MPTPLPDRPNLDQLKNQAKDLLKGHKAGDPEALRRIQANHPRLGASSVDEIQASRFTLSGAQLVVAREYGFSSWPKLKAHVAAPARILVSAVATGTAAESRKATKPRNDSGIFIIKPGSPGGAPRRLPGLRPGLLNAH